MSKGGNLLLNVGPDAKGNIPEESLERLAVIGKWMKKNGDSIYGCGKAGIEKPDFGRVTAKGKKLYFHMYENTIGPVPLPQLKKEDIASIRWLATGAEIPIPQAGCTATIRTLYLQTWVRIRCCPMKLIRFWK